MAQAAAASAPKAAVKSKTPVWVWEAKTKGGEVKKGEMEASDAEAVNTRLRSLGYAPVKVKKKSSGLPFAIPGLGGVGQKDLVIFTRTFATMIDAGLPLVQCLDLLATQTDNPAMKVVLTQVKTKVEGGATFAESLRDHPKVFDELYTQLVAAGEVGGILDTILNRLAAYIEKNAKLRRKVKGALTYPIIVLCVAVIVTAVLLLKVTPTFEKMFKDFGGQMPAPTQFVIDLSKFMQEYIIHMVLGVAAVVFAFRAFTANPKGRILFDRFILRVPMVGDVIRKVAVARFTRTLGTMISSGVPILDALDVVAKTAGNRTVEAAIYYTRSKISEGKTSPRRCSRPASSPAWWCR